MENIATNTISSNAALAQAQNEEELGEKETTNKLTIQSDDETPKENKTIGRALF